MITAHEASRERWLTGTPDLLTTSVNRNILQNTTDHEIRRKKDIKNTVEEVKKKTQKRHSSSVKDKMSRSSSSNSKGKQKENANGEEGRAPALRGTLTHHSSSSSARSDRSQLVDLVVEDTTAEDAERVRFVLSSPVVVDSIVY